MKFPPHVFDEELDCRCLRCGLPKQIMKDIKGFSRNEILELQVSQAKREIARMVDKAYESCNDI